MKRVAAAFLAALLVPSLALAANCSSLTGSNIVAYYGFNSGNANDATPNGSNGTATNVTFGNSYGIIGQGTSYNGSSSYISLPSAAYSTIFSSTNSYTIGLWMKYASVPGSGGQLLFSTDNASGYGYGSVYFQIDTFSGSTGEIGFFRAAGGAFDGGRTSAVTVSNWTFVTVTYDGSTITIYVNGSSAATFSSTKSPGTQSDGIIGAETYDTGSGNYNNWFSGYLDEVGIWNCALSSTQVTTLYNSGSGITYPFSSPAQFSFWQFADF